MTAHERIVSDPEIVTGKPVIRGTRITVELVLRLLGKGHAVDELAKSYQVTRDDILACQAYAADVVAKHGMVAAE
jgi:uncharacterized protein (DUF433 family)